MTNKLQELIEKLEQLVEFHEENLEDIKYPDNVSENVKENINKIYGAYSAIKESLSTIEDSFEQLQSLSSIEEEAEDNGNSSLCISINGKSISKENLEEIDKIFKKLLKNLDK